MLFSDPETPKKFCNSSDDVTICRLCEEQIKNNVNRLFSKTGLEKNYVNKIKETLGIIVLQTDIISKCICRPCATMVDKYAIFKNKCNTTQQNLMQKLRTKRINKDSPSGSNARQSKKHQSQHSETRKQLLYPEQNINTTLNENILIGNTQTKCKSVYDTNFDMFVTQPLKNNEIKNINMAVNTKIPHAISGTLNKLNTIDLANKKNILQQIDKQAESLCKRKGKTSILYHKGYEEISGFKLEFLWNEVVENFSFFIDMLNSISGEKCSVAETPHALKLKYCMIYSILMFHRWHELSLFQRLTTVLLLEGGCSKQVYPK